MTEEIQEKLIEEEMKQAYMDYAMSVIVSRALPDVRDGLKPVHRRILYAMMKEGLLHNKKYSKCAGVVGEVLKKYHPHGDSSVYDALVRMAQEWNLRYPLIDGHGNFGSVDGDSAAAYRYTECRLKKIAEELLIDIEKDTVDFADNFDGNVKEPLVLPGRIPNLLINGSSGIAVGMATNLPPHNLKEVCKAVIYLIDHRECNSADLMKFVKGPDFPTGGKILGESGIRNAYFHGKGKLIVRGKAEIEKDKIIISEIPYMVNKSLLIEDIAGLVKDKRVDGIHDIRDESDRKGMRVVIHLRKDLNAEVLLNQLYSLSNLQTTFGVSMLSLVNGEPKVLGLKDLVEEFVKHRKEVITRRTKFDLDKSEKRAHILEGLKVALQNIDIVIKGIKRSKDVGEARKFLVNKFKLSIEQADAILEMRLQKLTSLETEKIEKEYRDLLRLIKKLKAILGDENKIYDIIKHDMEKLIEEYGDNRRTEIIHGVQEDDIITDEDLINEEDIVITVTNSGYIKQLPLDTYKSQRRGGVGVRAASVKDEDIINDLFVTRNLNSLLFFTNKGKVHWLKAYQIPEASRYAKGKNLANLLRLGDKERVNAVLPIREFEEGISLLFATRGGILKKTLLKEFSKPRKGGILSINLKEKDEVVQVRLCHKGMKFVIGSESGRAVKFNEQDVREMGRTAGGVRGIKLIKDNVIGMENGDEGDLLTITENGYGKRTNLDEYRLISRGGKGVRNIKITEKNGKVVGIKNVHDDDEIMCITDKGQVIRTFVKDISRMGRNTQGVRVVRLREGDRVASVGKVVKSD